MGEEISTLMDDAFALIVLENNEDIWLDILEKKMIPAQSNVMFWHTGGFPAIFKYGNDIMNNMIK